MGMAALTGFGFGAIATIIITSLPCGIRSIKYVLAIGADFFRAVHNSRDSFLGMPLFSAIPGGILGGITTFVFLSAS